MVHYPAENPSQEAINPSYLLAWIPENLLNEKGSSEWDKFAKIEERAVLDDEDDGAPNALYDALIVMNTYRNSRCSTH